MQVCCVFFFLLVHKGASIVHLCFSISLIRRLRRTDVLYPNLLVILVNNIGKLGTKNFCFIVSKFRSCKFCIEVLYVCLFFWIAIYGNEKLFTFYRLLVYDFLRFFRSFHFFPLLLLPICNTFLLI